jgi:hypothetical protein
VSIAPQRFGDSRSGESVLAVWQAVTGGVHRHPIGAPTLVWMSKNAKPYAMKDSTLTIPRSSRR